MESQKKLSQLINKIYDYTAIIKQTVSNDTVLSDDQVAKHFLIKGKCLQALRDVVSLTESSKVTSATAHALSNLLSGVSLPNQLNRTTLQRAIDMCDILKKDIIVDDIVRNSKQETIELFQSELVSLKILFGFSDMFVLQKSTTNLFFDENIYEAMNSAHMKLIIDELARIQTCFLRGKLHKSYIPLWLFKFLYALNDFVIKKYKHTQTKTIPNQPSPPIFYSGVKKSPVLVNFDVSYKHLENFLLCESYISARDLCQNMIASFPDHERIGDLKSKLIEIQGYIEKIKQLMGDTKSHDIHNTPSSPKKMDPGLIDPTTGRIKDDFF